MGTFVRLLIISRGGSAFVTSSKALPGNNTMLVFKISTSEFERYLRSITSTETETTTVDTTPLANPDTLEV